MATRVIPVADDVYAKEKADIEARCVSGEVGGVLPLRDAVSRESVQPGGIVRLDPQTTMISHLVSSGAFKPMPAKTPAAGSEG